MPTYNLNDVVTNESHPVSIVNASTYHTLIPLYGPFFKENMELVHVSSSGVVTPQVPGVDFNFALMWISASRVLNDILYGGVTIQTPKDNGYYRFNRYKTAGSQWSVPVNQVYAFLVDNAYNPRIASWEQVIGEPALYPPTPHTQPLEDFKGFDEMIQAVDRLVNHIMSNPALSSHVVDPDAHGMMKANNVEIGVAVDDVINNRPITSTIADKVITLRHLKQFIEESGMLAPENTGAASIQDLINHTNSTTTHNDIRLLISALTTNTNNSLSTLTSNLNNHISAVDPHPQYMTVAEVDTKITEHNAATDPHPQYPTETEVDSKVTSHNSSPTAHTDIRTTLTNLQTSITNHSSATDPHSQYMTETEVDAKVGEHNAATDPHPQYPLITEVDSLLSSHNSSVDAHSDLRTLIAGKQDNLGFTPVQQGGGTNQGNNKIRIGWGTDGILRLQVDDSDFGAVWPMHITGNANYAENTRYGKDGYFSVSTSGRPILELHKEGFIAGAWYINDANRLAFGQTDSGGNVSAERFTIDIGSGDTTVGRDLAIGRNLYVLEKIISGTQSGVNGGFGFSGDHDSGMYSQQDGRVDFFVNNINTVALYQDKVRFNVPIENGYLSSHPETATSNDTSIATTGFVRAVISNKSDNGHTHSDYQPALGYTPVQQGGGTNQGDNKIYIGWTTAGNLGLHVDSTNFSANWPINITGSSSSVSNGVYTEGDQTINGNKTFTGTVKSLNGTEAQLHAEKSGTNSSSAFLYNNETQYGVWDTVYGRLISKRKSDNFIELGGILPVSYGGTGTDNAASARSNLGAISQSDALTLISQSLDGHTSTTNPHTQYSRILTQTIAMQDTGDGGGVTTTRVKTLSFSIHLEGPSVVTTINTTQFFSVSTPSDKSGTRYFVNGASALNGMTYFVNSSISSHSGIVSTYISAAGDYLVEMVYSVENIEPPANNIMLTWHCFVMIERN